MSRIAFRSAKNLMSIPLSLASMSEYVGYELRQKSRAST